MIAYLYLSLNISYEYRQINFHSINRLVIPNTPWRDSCTRVGVAKTESDSVNRVTGTLRSLRVLGSHRIAILVYEWGHV